MRGPIAGSEDALAHSERVDAERLIRTTVEVLSGGSAIHDLNGLVQRNAGRVSPADIRAGRVGSQVLGDIINTVEQAKGNSNFNWHSATPDQVKAYLLANGFDPARLMGMPGLPPRSSDASGNEGVGRAESTTAASLGAINQQNFTSTPFAAAGLSYATFSALRGEGFNAAQIMSAVNVNKELGLGANSNPGAIARLQRDVPSAIPGLRGTRDNWKQVHTLEEAEKRARAEGDTASADRLKREADEARKHAEEHDKQQRDHIRGQKPEREKDLIDKQDEIRRSVLGQAANLAPGQDPKQTVATIEAYRRNPNDAVARSNYEELKKRSAADPVRAKALAKVEAGLKEDAKLKKKVEGRNEEKTDQLTAVTVASDDLLGSMLDEPTSAQPAQAKAVTTAEKIPQKEAEKEKTVAAAPAEPKKPKVKLAGAPGPSA